MKRMRKMLAVFAGIITLYVAMIIWMYNEDTMKLMEQVSALMPALMDAIGFNKLDVTGLLSFMSLYLYGFILPACPMVFSIFCAHSLIAEYTDKGSMVSLLAAPVRRSAVAFTQLTALITGIFTLVVLASVVQMLVGSLKFPGELDSGRLLILNMGLFALQLFIGGISFFCSCFFSDAKRSLGFGAGIPLTMFVIKMLGNVGGFAENAKYFTFFTLFNPDGLAAGKGAAIAGAGALFLGAVALFAGAVTVFCKKDLHI